MNKLDIADHADVLTAIDLVKDEVDKEAKNVFAKSLVRLGVDKVAALGIVMAGEPLVAKSVAFKKTPTQISQLVGGLFVNTHSSTATKVTLLTKIAARLGVTLKIAKV